MNQKKTVMITGASRGIGRGTSLAFARAGYNLALCCHRNIEMLEALKAELKKDYQSEVLVRTLDVADFQEVSSFVADTLSYFGRIDVLVNNAGISHIGLLMDMSPEDWNRIVSTNLSSVFNFSNQVITSMVREKSGHIINISSVWGCVGASCEVAYSATKGGINAFTQALAKELAPSGISVNAIACGTIDTEMNQCFSEEERQILCDEIPAGRFGQANEVGEFVLSIAESSSYLTGQVIRFDGGWI